jgi:asparagine synthase (glutamine-hydrolysing)
MCAICGIVNFDRSHVVDSEVIRRMAGTMVHRGPDDDGFFNGGPAGLGFRRLSIIDLSGGHQPIWNEDRSATVVFNGEIYNYRDLSARLMGAGHTFATRSDTETILHAYEQYGDDCVDHLRGMFAFAIWDLKRERLLLARDRLGEKPLYYYQGNGFLAFASEIKALLEVPGIPRELDLAAFDEYLSLRFVPGPRTMFRNIHRLQPGHTLALEDGTVRIRKYWDVEYPKPATGTPAQLVDEFRHLLSESVRMRLMSEVPLGLFLSGGLDSSAILALMSRAGHGRVQTFSVGYEAPDSQQEDVSEFEYARLAANTYGAVHREYRQTAAEFEQFVPDLVRSLDEPMADPTCIPLHYISRLAREHVTVILSGEGADETLGGYNIYARMLALEKFNRVPARQTLAPWLARLAPSEAIRSYVRMSGQSLERRYRGVSRGFRPETKRLLIGEERMMQSELRLHEHFDHYYSAVRGTTPLNRMLYVDTKVWLPDDLLVKADRMSMANSLELRVPFLDHQLVEFAAALPMRSKLNGSCGKAILRDAMRGLLPDTIIDRPKKGFPVPLASWLCGPMRAFTRDHLLGSDSAACQFLNRTALTRIVEDHEQGRADRSGELWTALVFEIWHRHFLGSGLRTKQAVA